MQIRSAGALVALLLATASPAAAGSLQIGPVRIIMVGQQRAATVTVRNTGTTPSHVQIRTLDWTQPAGADVYAPSNTLRASPPQAAIAPGEAQTIRLVIQDVARTKVERAWRLVIDEIPDRTSPAGAGVQTAIRALVPVFLSPSTSASAKLRWTGAASADGLVVTAHNDGDGFERLIGLKVAADGRDLTASQPLEGYVLSHSRRSWTIAGAPAGAKSAEATGEGVAGAIKAHVAISP